jgi:hypothetical protein
MSGETPTNTGFDPQTIRGEGGISVSGSGHVIVSSGGPGGSGGIVQELYAENQTRPTSVTQPAPGGVFLPILSLNLTTTKGNFLDIDASLGATVDDLGLGANYIESGVRLLVDGVSTGLGSFLTSLMVFNWAPVELLNTSLVNFSMTARVPVTPGAHVVTLEWSVAGFAGGKTPVDSAIEFLAPDRDGCAMFVREVV